MNRELHVVFFCYGYDVLEETAKVLPELFLVYTGIRIEERSKRCRIVGGRPTRQIASAV